MSGIADDIAAAIRVRWPRLVATLEGRTAIFDERFAAVLVEELSRLNDSAALAAAQAFSEEHALDVLRTFCGAWGALGRVDDDPARRTLVTVLGRLVVAYDAVHTSHPHLDDQGHAIVYQFVALNEIQHR